MPPAKPSRASILRQRQKPVINALLNACDAKDGVKDGLIFNTQACDFDPVSTLTCRGAKTDACLTSQQTAALEKAFAGPKDEGPPGLSGIPL